MEVDEKTLERMYARSDDKPDIANQDLDMFERLEQLKIIKYFTKRYFVEARYDAGVEAYVKFRSSFRTEPTKIFEKVKKDKDAEELQEKNLEDLLELCSEELELNKQETKIYTKASKDSYRNDTNFADELDAHHIPSNYAQTYETLAHKLLKNIKTTKREKSRYYHICSKSIILKTKKTETDELEKALTYCKKALRNDNNYTEALKTKGDIYLLLYDTKNAINCYLKAKKSNPLDNETDDLILRLLSDNMTYYEKNGDYNVALKQYMQYNKKFPDNPKVLEKIGDLYTKIKKPKKAKKFYEKALWGDLNNKKIRKKFNENLKKQPRKDKIKKPKNIEKKKESKAEYLAVLSEITIEDLLSDLKLNPITRYIYKKQIKKGLNKIDGDYFGRNVFVVEKKPEKLSDIAQYYYDKIKDSTLEDYLDIYYIKTSKKNKKYDEEKIVGLYNRPHPFAELAISSLVIGSIAYYGVKTWGELAQIEPIKIWETTTEGHDVVHDYGDAEVITHVPQTKKSYHLNLEHIIGGLSFLTMLSNKIRLNKKELKYKFRIDKQFSELKKILKN